MSDVTMLEADENELRVRALCLSWAEGYALALTHAVEAVTALRRAFNEFAETDPYETRKVERWDLSADAVRKEPVVQKMADTFSLVLNRRGLLKIDPS